MGFLRHTLGDERREGWGRIGRADAGFTHENIHLYCFVSWVVICLHILLTGEWGYQCFIGAYLCLHSRAVCSERVDRLLFFHVCTSTFV